MLMFKSPGRQAQFPDAAWPRLLKFVFCGFPPSGHVADDINGVGIWRPFPENPSAFVKVQAEKFMSCRKIRQRYFALGQPAFGIHDFLEPPPNGVLIWL